MQRYDYRVDLFAEESVKTEATAYRLLCRDPLDADVNYFAAPWSVLINRRDLGVPDMRLDGGFTICQHVDFRRILPICLRLGLDTLFTPHVVRGFRGPAPDWLRWAGRTPVVGRLLRRRVLATADFRVLPFPHVTINTAPPAQKDLWYSFIGSNTHPARDAIFALPPRADTVIKLREKWHFDVRVPQQREAEKREYQEVLARSRFALCPRGFGPSTIRFWEALRAEAIPVLIADTMSLPHGFDWDSCIVRIPQREAGRLEKRLSDISWEQEQQLRVNCREAARRFTGDNLVSGIRSHYRAHPPQRAAA